MKILKIFEEFITNSSSVSATILLAARKNKDFDYMLYQTGLPTGWEEEFEMVNLEIEKDDYIKYKDLFDEYDLYEMNYGLAHWGDGDEPYEGEVECDAYNILIKYKSEDNSRVNIINDDLILLYIDIV